MFIVWTGLGWLFFLIPCVILIIGGFMIDIIGIEMPKYLGHFVGSGLMLSWLPMWFLGKKVNKEKTEVDPVTGVTTTVKNKHTLWYLPVQYCSFIFLGLGIICPVIALIAQKG